MTVALHYDDGPMPGLGTIAAHLPAWPALDHLRSLGGLRRSAGPPVRRAATLGVAGLMAVGAVVPVARRLTGPRPVRRRRDRRSMVIPISGALPDGDALPFTIRWPDEAAEPATAVSPD